MCGSGRWIDPLRRYWVGYMYPFVALVTFTTWATLPKSTSPTYWDLRHGNVMFGVMRLNYDPYLKLKLSFLYLDVVAWLLMFACNTPYMPKFKWYEYLNASLLQAKMFDNLRCLKNFVHSILKNFGKSSLRGAKSKPSAYPKPFAPTIHHMSRMQRRPLVCEVMDVTSVPKKHMRICMPQE